MDVGATLADYAEASQATFSNARSLRPVLEGRTAAHRDHALCEFAGQRCVITPEMKIEFDAVGNACLAFDRTDGPERTDVSRQPRYSSSIRQAWSWLSSRRIPARTTVPTTLERYC